MKILIIIVVCFLIICILFSLILIYVFNELGKSFAPNSIEKSISILKEFLGLDFGDEYEVLEHQSNNFINMFKLIIILKLPPKAYHEVLDYVSNSDNSKMLHEDDSSFLANHWEKIENGYQMNQESKNRPTVGILRLNTDSQIISYEEWDFIFN